MADDGLMGDVLDTLGDAAGDAYDWVFGSDDEAGAGGDAALDGFDFGLGMGGDAGVSFAGPSSGQLNDIAASGGDIVPYLPPEAVNAASGLVSALLGDSPTAAAARSLLTRATGWIFGRSPTYNGSPMTFVLTEMMLSDMSLDDVRALAWRAGGGESPRPNAAKKEREAFALLFCYDAMRALNADDLAMAIIDQTPQRKRRG